MVWNEKLSVIFLKDGKYYHYLMPSVYNMGPNLISFLLTQEMF